MPVLSSLRHYSIPEPISGSATAEGVPRSHQDFEAKAILQFACRRPPLNHVHPRTQRDTACRQIQDTSKVSGQRSCRKAVARDFSSGLEIICVNTAQRAAGECHAALCDDRAVIPGIAYLKRQWDGGKIPDYAVHTLVFWLASRGIDFGDIAPWRSLAGRAERRREASHLGRKRRAEVLSENLPMDLGSNAGDSSARVTLSEVNAR